MGAYGDGGFRPVMDARLDDAPARVQFAMFYCVFAAVIAASLCYFRHYLGGPGAVIFNTNAVVSVTPPTQ